MSTTELNTTVSDLQELKRMREDLEAEITALEDQLKAHMTENGIDSFTAGAFKVTWKEVTSTRLDTVALRKTMPADVLAPFLRTSTSRPLKIT